MSTNGAFTLLPEWMPRFCFKQENPMNYFIGATTVEEIKARYRRLAMSHHPDRGGDAEVMKALNHEYHETLRKCHGTTTKGSEGAEHTYYYNETVEQAVMDKLAQLIGFSFPNVRILLVGTWIWVDGATKPVKEQLKATGLHWHSQREKWYWHAGRYRRGKSNAGFEAIAVKYGYREFESSKRKELDL
jgi:curved DNA-binding protein CbpA